MSKVEWKLIEENIAKRTLRKLDQDKRKVYEDQIAKIRDNPFIGQMKTGPLKGIRVLNFNYKGSIESIAYRLDTKNHIITLLYYGTHENFYKRLRRALGL